MSKKLLLTLLPLTFLVAACSGGNKPAQSSSQPTGSSVSSDPGTSLSVSSDPGTSLSVSSDPGTASTSEADPSVDPRGHAQLVGEGYEIKIGDLYYTLDETEADPGRTASYNLLAVALTAGEKITVHLDGGDALSIWAEADATNGVYPNYDERPQSEQYTEFTVTEDAVDGNVYFHVNSDDSYSLWLTPNQSGEGEGGGEGGEVVENKYCIYSVTNEAAVADLVLKGKDPAGKDQAEAKGVSLTQGDVIQLYDKENAAGWITTVEGWSFGGDSGTSTAWEAYLEAGTDSWTVLQDVTVDIYAKFQMNNDSIYFGISTAA